MKKISLIVILVFTLFNLQAQVGIGTTTPDSSSILDITSTDKGILVPRISLVAITNLTTPINTPAIGLLIWNTNATVTGGNGIGFYFYNGAQWTPITQTATDDHDFYETGTTNAPDNITDNIFHTGDLSIGIDANGPKLTIQDNTNDTEPALKINRTTTSLNSYAINVNSTLSTTGGGLNVIVNGTLPSGRSAYGILNDLTNVTGSGIANMSGIRNLMDSDAAIPISGVSNRLLGLGTNNKIGVITTFGNNSGGNNYGVSNNIQSTANTLKYGVHNQFETNSGGTVFGIRNNIHSNSTNNKYGMYNHFYKHFGFNSPPDGTMYGIYNTFDPNITGAFSKYGIYNIIPSTTAGINYGIYSDVKANNSFAGYFLGRLSIGTTTTNNYILPTSRGIINQIMKTDGSGNVTWQTDISDSFWSRTGTNLDVATAADDINFSSDQTSITFPATSGTPSPMIYMFDGGGFSNSDRMVLSHSTTYNNWGLQYRDTDDSFRFLGEGTDRVTINLATGNPLVVNGNAEATSFISSTTTYPDYVFESYYNETSEINKTYAFKTLNEVEIYIKKNGHLPGVKSYKDVKENGMTINLVETSVINLEKIEELFLYIIELKKENDQLKENQKKLKTRLLQIEALLQNKN